MESNQEKRHVKRTQKDYTGFANKQARTDLGIGHYLYRKKRKNLLLFCPEIAMQKNILMKIKK